MDKLGITSTEDAVRINGGVQVAAGALLTLNKLPRLAALALAATLVPTTAAGHRFWEGGLGLDYDRVVPVDAVESASDERVSLKLSAVDFKDAPEYTQESFEAPEDVTPSEFDLPDVVNYAQQLAGALNSTAASTWIVPRLKSSAKIACSSASSSAENASTIGS